MPALADGKLELASPAYRLCAITINQLFQYIIFLPIYIYSLLALFEAMEEEYDSDELTEFFLEWLTLPQTLTIIIITIWVLKLLALMDKIRDLLVLSYFAKVF